MLNSKDNQNLRLLNQIATDMVKRSDWEDTIQGRRGQGPEQIYAILNYDMNEFIIMVLTLYLCVLGTLQYRNSGK